MIEVYDINRGRSFFNDSSFINNLQSGQHADYKIEATEAIFEAEYSGAESLSVTCPLSEYIRNGTQIFTIGSIVRADILSYTIYDVSTTEETDPHRLFSIYYIEVDNEEVTFKAEPLTDRMLRSKFAIDVRPTNMNSYEAFIYLKDRCFGTTPIDMHSGGGGIAEPNTAYYENVSMLEAIKGEQDNSVINRWRQSYFNTNSGVAFIDELDDDLRGTVWTFEYGKDITGLRVQHDGSAIVRWIRPKGYNGVTMSINYTHVSGLAQNGGVWSPDSTTPIISVRNLFSPKKAIDFNHIKMRADVRDDEETAGLVICDTQADLDLALYEACIDFYDKDKVDKAKITIDINVLDLSKNTEISPTIREALKNKVSLGDKIRVKSLPHGVDAIVRVISVVYDCLSEEITGLTLSNSEYDFFRLLNESVDTSKKVYQDRV